MKPMSPFMKHNCVWVQEILDKLKRELEKAWKENENIRHKKLLDKENEPPLAQDSAYEAEQECHTVQSTKETPLAPGTPYAT
jgi:hypothetical protein